MNHTIFQLLHIDRFGWRSFVDIIVLTVIIYQILRIFRGTRAFRMLYGILVLVIAYILTEPGRMMALPTVNRVLGALLLFTPLAIVVLFQNHIRRMLAIVGSNPLAGFTRTPGAEKIIEELVLAAATLSSKRYGALIVLEREQGMRTFAETGIEIDSAVSYDLLTTIFMPHTPLHDGAVIIADGRLRAASCFLPLTTGPRLSHEYGSRHRAAIGITEETDAIAIVVSEETGAISLVREGRITRGLEPQELRAALAYLLIPPHTRRRQERAAELHPAAVPHEPSPVRQPASSQAIDGTPHASSGASEPALRDPAVDVIERTERSDIPRDLDGSASTEHEAPAASESPVVDARDRRAGGPEFH